MSIGKAALSAGLLLALVLVVDQAVGWAALLAPWGSLPAYDALGALLLVFASYIFRAVRLYRWMGPGPSPTGYSENGLQLPATLLRIVLQHNCLNNLLPFRTGEAALPLLLRRHLNLPLLRGTATLLWLRVLDLAVVGTVALVLTGYQILGFALGIGLAAIVFCLPFALYFYFSRGAQDSRWPTRTDSEARHSEGDGESPESEHGGRWWNKARGQVRALTRSPPPPLRLVEGVFWTWANWLIKLAALAWLLAAFVNVGWSEAWLGALAGELSSVLPVHGVAGLGTYEGAVVLALSAWGISVTSALAGAVNLHLFVLGASILGAACAFALPAGKSYDHNSPPEP